MEMRPVVLGFAATLVLLSATAPAAEPTVTGIAAEQRTGQRRQAVGGEDVAALLEKTGIRGGLCLVVGAKDTGRAGALAAGSALYVQVLQPDANLASQWGAEFAGQDCQDREQLGVRCAAFDPEHYGTDLFNLIVVEDPRALGAARLADLCRILVPNGCVAFRSARQPFAAEAKALEMESSAAGCHRAGF